MLKKVSVGLACLGCLVVSLCAIYFIRYLADWEPEEQAPSAAEPAKENQITGPSAISSHPVTVDVAAQKKTIDMDTEYYVTIVDLDAHTSIRRHENMPNEWMGFTKEALTAYLEEYVAKLPLEETDQGLSSFELVRFSSSCVETKKTYQPSMVRFQYYVTEKNHMVVVYHKDKRTVYEYTGIDSRILPVAEQLKLRDGIYLYSAEELYGLLESYSS